MSLLQLKLDVVNADISRTIAVPEAFTLAFLHAAIQEVFGWMDYHLHQFTDAKGVLYGDREAPPLEDERAFRPEDEVLMKRIFKKPGDNLDYEYDFGDCNEVKITLLGRSRCARLEHFASRGTDLIEDSAGFGGTEGVVKILREKGGRKKSDVLAWLAGAFRKSPEAVLHEPDAIEIFLRIYRLVHLVSVAEGFVRPASPHDSYIDCLMNLH